MAFTKSDKQFLQDTFATKADIQGIKTDIAGLKTDVTEVKTDIIGMKTDIAGMKVDIAGLKTDVSRVEKKIDDLSAFVEPAIGNIFSWTDDIHEAFIGQKKTSNIPSEN